MGRLIQDPQLFEQMSEALVRINALAKKLEDGDGTLGKALNDKTLYLDASHAVAELDSLLKDLRRNPQRYLKVEIF